MSSPLNSISRGGAWKLVSGRVLYLQFGYWNDEREEEEEKEEENGMLVSDGGGLGFYVSFLFLFFSDS
ncbi:hypothetical protein D8674_030820 [Pyrus ussuriensis x Pyrus communis]|uniref:Uncharacterized protein n=1 Tax=Pyrus ussuriensis x Pyrus communis TaxID=2448454 RepID=A0A5N5F2F3_9ROSA|nr:hypothetical protein D8674_030820 [Pyrus ussuriensis x Pyrus communis]